MRITFAAFAVGTMVGEDGKRLSRSRTFTDSALHQPYPLGICLVSVFGIFITELVAFRWGTAKLAKLGITVPDAHSHGAPAGAVPPGVAPSGSGMIEEEHDHLHQHHGVLHGHDKEGAGSEKGSGGDVESITKLKADLREAAPIDSPAAQILGIAILEFGVLLHSVLIGLTLAVDEQFTILFVVIIFHRKSSWACVGW